MIRLEKVTKHYGSIKAVSALSFEVNEGEVCVLIGPSGCGKTTTLRMINRLIEPTSGHIFIDGRDTREFKAEQLRRTIGYAIQSVGLFPHMTVAENIGVVPRLLHWEKTKIAHRVRELLTLVNLDPAEVSGKYPKELSGGQAQRVGVARALAADPPILLMDEPFGAVDPLTRERLQAQFIRIQQEIRKTIILVTHDLDEAIRLADRIAIMGSGKLVQYDTPEAILSRPVNKFVRDFVGTDRALKRLSRISINDFVRSSSSININATMKEVNALDKDLRWLWVVDAEKKLKGWLDRNNLSGATTVKEEMDVVNVEEVALTRGSTLREALSRMLGQGFGSVPVVDEGGRLLGEVRLHDVEAATAEAGS